MMERAALWDLDGTLLDSAEFHWISWQEVLQAENFELSRERFFASFGMRNDAILRDYFGEGISTKDIARITDAKEEKYREMVKEGGIELLPGVLFWLEKLEKAGWRQAIASSAPLKNIEVILEVFGIKKFFQAVVSAQDVQRGKPDPETFLAAAKKIDLPPSRCVVIEDAPAGIEGGKRAGLRTIGVLSTHPSLQADLVVRSLEELSPDAFEKLLP